MKTSGEVNSLLDTPIYTGQAQREENKHIKRGAKIELGASLLLCLLGQPSLMPPGCIFIRLPIKLSYNTGPSVTSNFCCSKTELRKLHTSPAVSWLQSPFAVILEPKKIKSVTVSIVFPSICHEVTRTDSMIPVF